MGARDAYKGVRGLLLRLREAWCESCACERGAPGGCARAGEMPSLWGAWVDVRRVCGCWCCVGAWRGVVVHHPRRGRTRVTGTVCVNQKKVNIYCQKKKKKKKLFFQKKKKKKKKK